MFVLKLRFHPLHVPPSVSFSICRLLQGSFFSKILEEVCTDTLRSDLHWICRWNQRHRRSVGRRGCPAVAVLSSFTPMDDGVIPGRNTVESALRR